MRVLIAGGAGFVGSHPCEQILTDGHRVLCVDNLSTGRKENLAGLMESNRFEFQHVNMGFGDDLTILELTKLVLEVVGFNGTILKDLTKPDGTPRKLMDTTKLHKIWLATIYQNKRRTYKHVRMVSSQWRRKS